MFGTLLSRKDLLYHALLVLCPFWLLMESSAQETSNCGGETWGTDLHLCVAALFDPASRGFGHQLRAQGLQIRRMVGS